MISLPASPVDALCTPCLKCFKLNRSPFPVYILKTLVYKYVYNFKWAGSCVKTNMKYTYIHKCGHIYLVLENDNKMLMVLFLCPPPFLYTHTLLPDLCEWNQNIDCCKRKPWKLLSVHRTFDRAVFVCLFKGVWTLWACAWISEPWRITLYPDQVR